MYILHWEHMAGSIVVQAILHDVQAEFDLCYVDMGRGEHKERDYLGINPIGRVPALTLPDGSTIGEWSDRGVHLIKAKEPLIAQPCQYPTLGQQDSAFRGLHTLLTGGGFALGV